MSLNLYQCPRCNTADIKPEHVCPATDGRKAPNGKIIDSDNPRCRRRKLKEAVSGV